MTDITVGAGMKYKEQMMRLCGQRDKTYQDIIDLLTRACVGAGHPSFNRIADYYTWDCENSPVGICVYDSLDDPSHDDCLYCHGPEERK